MVFGGFYGVPGANDLCGKSGEEIPRWHCERSDRVGTCRMLESCMNRGTQPLNGGLELHQAHRRFTHRRAQAAAPAVAAVAC